MTIVRTPPPSRWSRLENIRAEATGSKTTAGQREADSQFQRVLTVCTSAAAHRDGQRWNDPKKLLEKMARVTGA